MKKLYTSFLIFFATGFFSQNMYNQYFDGADTSASNSLFIKLDTAASNIWQIGRPHKTIFDSAATSPNAIVTDTVNFYPSNNTSVFSFSVIPAWFGWSIFAIQWKQKLDLDHGKDGGLVEFSLDGGVTWQNSFGNPYVYNFYGYESANVDTLPGGQLAFTGTDSTWKDIWLCYGTMAMQPDDTLMMRFVLKTDSVNNNKEGWMIDNFMTHTTFIHTAKNMEQKSYMRVFPTVTTGIVNIETEKLQQYHIIESIELRSIDGRVVERFGQSPTKYSIDLKNHPNGLYYLKVSTNLRSETFQILISK